MPLFEGLNSFFSFFFLLFLLCQLFGVFAELNENDAQQKRMRPSVADVIGEKLLDAVNGVASELHKNDAELKKRFLLWVCFGLENLMLKYPLFWLSFLVSSVFLFAIYSSRWWA